MHNKKYKQKNTAIHKKMKQLQQKKRIPNQPLQKIVPFSNRKSTYYNHQRPSPWKQMIIGVFAVLIIFILAVPAIIVQITKTDNQISAGVEVVDTGEENPDKENGAEDTSEETAAGRKQWRSGHLHLMYLSCG